MKCGFLFSIKHPRYTVGLFQCMLTEDVTSAFFSLTESSSNIWCIFCANIQIFNKKKRGAIFHFEVLPLRLYKVFFLCVKLNLVY